MGRMPQYGVALEQIPADLMQFDAKWGRGPVRMLPLGFKTKTEFSTWRSQTRAAINRVINGADEDPQPIAQADEWTLLEASLAQIGISSKKN